MDTAPKLQDWHLLMHEWLKQGKGTTGITLPFLAGALAYKESKNEVLHPELRALIDTMTSQPVEGYFVGVRWCHNIDAPVLSSLLLNDPLVRKCEKYSPHGQLSFAFSPDAMTSVGGLNCNSHTDCEEKLIRYSLEHTEKGCFSRARNTENAFIYRKFDQKEIEFIESVIR
jgi:hypothetical protein